eukprot:s2016_g7.t1
MSIQARFVVGQCHNGSTRAFLLPVGISPDEADGQFVLREKGEITNILQKNYSKTMLKGLAGTLNLELNPKDDKEGMSNKIAERLVEGLDEVPPTRDFNTTPFLEDIGKSLVQEMLTSPDKTNAKETIRGLVEKLMAQTDPDTWCDAETSALKMLCAVKATLGDFADDLISKFQEKKTTLEEKMMAKNDANQGLRDALVSVNEKIMKQEQLYITAYNRAFHGSEFDYVGSRLKMLYNIRTNIKVSLGIDDSDGKATLEKVVNEDVELNEKSDKTKGTAIVYASKRGYTAKWFYHYTSQCKILDLQHAIVRVIGIPMGGDSPFRLSYPSGRSNFELWEPMEATLVNDKSIILTIAGLLGGCKGQPVKKQTEKKKFAEKLKSEMPTETLQNTKFMSSFEAFTTIQQMLNTVVSNAEIDPIKNLENLAQQCSNDQLGKSLEALNSSDNSVQGRLKKCAQYIYGDEMVKIIAMKEEIDALLDGATMVLQYSFTQACVKDTSFNLGKLKQMISQAQAFKAGVQSAQDDAML